MAARPPTGGERGLSNWAIILSLIFVAPIGAVLVWTLRRNWPLAGRVAAAAWGLIMLPLWLAALFGPKSPQPTSAAPAASSIVAALTPTAAPAVPTAAPTVAPTAAPTAPPQPTAAPTPVPLVVTGAGVEGVSIRRSPGTGERIKTWPDGTEMVPLGEQQQAAGRNWEKVRDPDGNQGWVAADFLVAKSSAPAAPQPTQAVAKPTTASATSGVQFVSVNGGPPGGRASVTVQTAPGVACSITYITPSRAVSEAQGLGITTADANGRASWSWVIGSSTQTGTGTVRVTCGAAMASSPIEIR